MLLLLNDMNNMLATSNILMLISNMTPRLSGHFFAVFGFVFLVLKTLQGIARQWSREKTLQSC